MQGCESMDNERGLIMEVKKAIGALEESRVDILKIISRNPKDEEAKSILSTLELVKEIFEKEEFKTKKLIKAYGSIEVEIEDYRFRKDERSSKGIAVYEVDVDGLYEYIDNIKLCKEYLESINDIESLKKIAIKWYKEELDKGIKKGDKTLNEIRKELDLHPIEDGDQYYHREIQ